MADESADRMRERADSEPLAWLLLDADRRLLAFAIVLAVFLALVGCGVLLPGAAAVLVAGDAIETLFQAYVGATITGVTLVLTLNQLVLSQELGSVGDQRERMEGAMTVRDDVADVLDAPVSPADPSAFLRALVEAADERAAAVTETLDTDDEQAREDVETLVERTRENAGVVSDRLAGERFGSFGVVAAALDFNYSWKLYAARRAAREHEGALGEATRDALADLAGTLRLFGPAREHFKTLYFQSELIDLSRTILAVAVPAVVVATAVLLFFAPISGAVLGVSGSVLLVAGASALVLAPFAVLLSYVLRIATVAGRTLSVGPFILRDTDRDEDLSWAGDEG